MNVAVGRLHFSVSMQPAEPAETPAPADDETLERSFRRQQLRRELDGEREHWMLQYRGHHYPNL